MKYEWKKEEKEIYLPKSIPVLINVPKYKYFCISGKGNPNLEDFSNRVGVLYNMSYCVRMMPKNGFTPTGYFEYTVYPLEGLWNLTDEGKKSDTLNKDELLYKIMIRQPDFVDDNVFKKALDMTRIKKPSILLDNVTFEEIEDGLSVEMMHIGSYDDEPASFNKMKNYIKDNNLKIKSLIHREIYISDARKVETLKRKTVLRYRVEK